MLIKQPEATRSNPKQPEATRSNPKQPEATRSNPKQVNKLIALLVVLVAVTFSSCNEDSEESILEANRQEAVLLDSEAKNEVLGDIERIANIIEEIALSDPKGLSEVLEAVESKYYLDEMVFASDLLMESDLYNYKPFIERSRSLRSFREAFESAESVIPFSEVNDNVTVYIPYSENHDLENPTSITVVTAQEDTDAAYGFFYEKGEKEKVYVDDDYAESNLTLIVGINQLRKDAATYEDERDLTNDSGDSKDIESSENISGIESILRVSNSKAKLRKQYDNLISFTGNGGGSEIRIARISAYLAPENGQINGFEGDKRSVSFSRSDISRKRTKTVTSVWDFNWIEDNLEQIYAVYEDDTQNTQTFNGSLTTTITRNLPNGAGSNTTVGTLGYSVTITSKDPIITEMKIRRVDYINDYVPKTMFLLDLDDEDCIEDNIYIPIVSLLRWPALDCGTDWSFTLPNR